MLRIIVFLLLYKNLRLDRLCRKDICFVLRFKGLEVKAKGSYPVRETCHFNSG